MPYRHYPLSVISGVGISIMDWSLYKGTLGDGIENLNSLVLGVNMANYYRCLLRHWLPGTAGFLAIAGTFYKLLDFKTFFIASILSFFLILLTMVAMCQEDQTKQLRIVLQPLIIDHLKKFGANGVNYITEIANNSGSNNIIIDILDDVLHVKEDPTERYWIYICISNIGGKKAKSIIERGLADEDEFARLGANEAWKILNK